MTIRDLQKVYPMFDLIDKGQDIKHPFMRFQAISKRAAETTLHATAETLDSLADQLAVLRSKHVR